MYLADPSGFVHVVLDVFRVGCDHRAVVVVSCFRELVALVRNARIEDVRQPWRISHVDMTVREFCRVALGLTRDGLDTQLVDLSSWMSGTARRGIPVP